MVTNTILPGSLVAVQRARHVYGLMPPDWLLIAYEHYLNL